MVDCEIIILVYKQSSKNKKKTKKQQQNIQPTGLAKIRVRTAIYSVKYTVAFDKARVGEGKKEDKNTTSRK